MDPIKPEDLPGGLAITRDDLKAHHYTCQLCFRVFSRPPDPCSAWDCPERVRRSLGRSSIDGWGT